MQTTSKTRLAVMFGGKSPEHEVSIITAIQVMQNADKDIYEIIPIYIAKDGKWYTGQELEKIETYKSLDAISDVATASSIAPDPTKKGLQITGSRSLVFFQKEQLQTLDVIFPCFHGGLGEGGGFQGFLEITEIPYVGAGLMGAVAGMDKVLMKQLFASNQLPITKYLWFYRNEWTEDEKKVIGNIERTLQYPLFVKPANGGSSIGITKVKTTKELQNAIEVAVLFDRKIIIEEGFEDAQEINISVMGNSGSALQTSVCEEVFSTGELLSFDDKYTSGGKSSGMASTKRQIPAKLEKEIEKKIQDIAKKAYRAVDCFGLARIDFRVKEKTNEVVILEINTIPGSMSYYLWEASGMSFTHVITKLVELAFERNEDRKKNTTTFSSNILEGYKPGLKTGKKF